MIEVFVKSINFELSYIVIDYKKRKTTEKTKKELNKNDKRMFAQNVQIMSIFCRVFNKDALERVKDCKSTKEILRKSKETYKSKSLTY